MRNKINISGKAGFTLIELIVVIAIMAILGGTATVGYSAYVNKANESADRQMISDIEQALILGAYSKNYKPGSAVAVGVSRGADATASDADYNGDGVNDVEEMMIAAFGTNWKETLRLQWDGWSDYDQGLILQAMQGVNSAYFNSVPGSSFYGAEGSTADLTAKVDEITGIFANIGEGHTFSLFWPSDFQDKAADLDYSKTENANMAANLTVMAAANEIANQSPAVQQAWINSWTGNGSTSVDDKDYSDASAYGTGYVAPLVMDYAKQVAFLNYAKANLDTSASLFNELILDEINLAYNTMNNNLGNLASNEDGNYIENFNAALSNFKNTVTGDTTLNDLYSQWQTVDGTTGKSQAQVDAEAFIASMAAVNALEDNYVNKENASNLNQANAFTNLGAADILDDMVSYATVNTNGEWVIIVTVDGSNTPTVEVLVPTN